MSLEKPNQYHLFIQKKVIDQLNGTGDVLGVSGRCLLYIFPPGTGFDPEKGVKDGDNELVEIKVRYPNRQEKKITEKAKKTFKDMQKVTRIH